MTSGNGETLGRSEGRIGGMSDEDIELLRWLGGDTSQLASETAKAQTNGHIEAVPEWMKPKDSTTEAVLEPEPSSPEPQTDVWTDIGWQQPWRQTAEESELDVSPERRNTISKGLHALTDERRILMLALIGMNPEGANGNEILERYRKLLGTDQPPESKIPVDQIETWLVGNGLCQIISRNNSGIRYIALTDEGKILLPMLGHLIDWSSTNGRLRPLLGQPPDAEFRLDDPQGQAIRQNFEQLAYILAHPREVLRAADLIGIEGTSETRTRRRMTELKDTRWITYVPGSVQPEGNYPVFEPSGPLRDVGKPVNVREALLKYILTKQAQNPGPMTLHGLVFHRKFIEVSRTFDGSREFARAIVQEYERFYSEGLVHEIDPGKMAGTGLVINPAKELAVRNLVDLVRGAETGSEDYQTQGLQKLFQHLTDPSERLRQLISKAGIARN